MLFVDAVRPVHMREKLLKDPMLKMGAIEKSYPVSSGFYAG